MPYLWGMVAINFQAGKIPHFIHVLCLALILSSPTCSRTYGGILMIWEGAADWDFASFFPWPTGCIHFLGNLPVNFLHTERAVNLFSRFCLSLPRIINGSGYSWYCWIFEHHSMAWQDVEAHPISILLVEKNILPLSNSSLVHKQGNFCPCMSYVQSGQNVLSYLPKYIRFNKKFRVLLHTKKLSPFRLQGGQAWVKFKAPIETGVQTIPRNTVFL